MSEVIKSPSYCKTCDSELPEGLEGPCPNCGGVNKTKTITIIQPIHVSDSLTKVKLTWKRHPYLKGICWILAFSSLMIGLFLSNPVIGFIVSLVIFAIERIISFYSDNEPIMSVH